MENVVASLNVVAARCRELGIMCVLENKLPHLLFGNTSDILWILDAISTSEIGACLDTGHATIAGDIFTCCTNSRDISGSFMRTTTTATRTYIAPRATG